MALRSVLNQFLETFRKFTTLQRVSLLAGAVAVFAVSVVLILWANKPAYRTLYSDLKEQDVKDVADALNKKDVKYKVVGDTITVPAESVYSTRIALALDGLPKDQGVGFELFDGKNLGMTEFAQNVNYQRAMQGELARSISSLNEVVDAKVHLSVPKERIFADSEEEGSKASVIVRLMPGVTLNEDQVRAITHLVASAVRGLTPKAVQVMDTTGNLLSEFLDEDRQTLQQTQTQIEQQRQIEKDLEKRVRGMLAPVMGGIRYAVGVSVTMDYNRKDITREEYGDTPVLRSQRSLEINASNTGKGPQGIPGVESNLAEPDLLIDGIMSEYSKSEEVQNFEISKTVTREQVLNGVISRVTVSVMVDDKPERQTDNGTTTIVKRPFTEDEITRLRTVVATAVGYNGARGDEVNVTNLSFDTSEEWETVDTAQKEKLMEYVSMAAKYGAAILILILFYALFVRPILKRLDRAKELDEEMLGENAIDAQIQSLDITVGGDTGFPKTVEELEREIESELDESVPVDVEAVKSKVMLKKIEEASNEDPEMVANLLKAMVKGA